MLPFRHCCLPRYPVNLLTNCCSTEKCVYEWTQWTTWQHYIHFISNFIVCQLTVVGSFDIIGLKWGRYLPESQYDCGPCIKVPMQKDSRCYLKQKNKIKKKNIILLCLRTRTNMLWYRRWNFPWVCYVLYQFLSYILIFQFFFYTRKELVG